MPVGSPPQPAGMQPPLQPSGPHTIFWVNVCWCESVTAATAAPTATTAPPPITNHLVDPPLLVSTPAGSVVSALALVTVGVSVAFAGRSTLVATTVFAATSGVNRALKTKSFPGLLAISFFSGVKP